MTKNAESPEGLLPPELSLNYFKTTSTSLVYHDRDQIAEEQKGEYGETTSLLQQNGSVGKR